MTTVGKNRRGYILSRQTENGKNTDFERTVATCG